MKPERNDSPDWHEAHRFTTLEARMGYTFADKQRLALALTHPSCSIIEASLTTNQRLEFLGDAVLKHIVATTLFELYPDQREGFLTEALNALVSGQALATLASELRLDEHLRVSQQARNEGVPASDRALAETFEALLGAIYLDGGLDGARAFWQRCAGDVCERVNAGLESANPKGRLQEIIQRDGSQPPMYRVVAENGMAKEKTFDVEVSARGIVLGAGRGSSKKAAEEAAAKDALDLLQKVAS